MRKHINIILALLFLFLCSCSLGTTELKEATVADKIIAKHPNLESVVRDSEKMGAEFIVEKGLPMLIYDGIKSPVALGAPEYSDSELLKMSFPDAISSVSSYIDALRYFRLSHSADESYILLPEECAQLLHHYDTVGLLNVNTDSNEQYPLLYIVQDNQYYVLDVANDIYGSAFWMDYCNADSLVFSSGDEMTAAVLNSNPDLISGKPNSVEVSVISSRK